MGRGEQKLFRAPWRRPSRPTIASPLRWILPLVIGLSGCSSCLDDESSPQARPQGERRNTVPVPSANLLPVQPNNLLPIPAVPPLHEIGAGGAEPVEVNVDGG